ncbi:hypothetical protein MSAN_00928300 [Mycena sanguinolenta]|uniref:Uncharacterized protein n=1 Tax=Mycena sanguinolenta TaxID=230812 RepID=A0A8H7DBH5_9AGAR|nr:hypothetical protein MSAN_00928300 [Mycena sanguinolenta]
MADVAISGNQFNLTQLKRLLNPGAPSTEHRRWLGIFSMFGDLDKNIRTVQNGPNDARGTWIPLKYLNLCMVAIGVADDTREKTLENLKDFLPTQEKMHCGPSSKDDFTTPMVVFGPIAVEHDSQANTSVADGDEPIAAPLLKLRAEEKTLQKALQKAQEQYAMEEKALQNALQRARKEYAQEEKALQKALHKVKQDHAREEAIQKAREEEARQEALQKAREEAFQRAEAYAREEEKAREELLWAVREDYRRRGQMLQQALKEAQDEYMWEILQKGLQELQAEYEQKVLQIQLFGAPVVDA